MFDLLLTLFLGFILLFLLSSGFRQWLLVLFLRGVQRRIEEEAKRRRASWTRDAQGPHSTGEDETRKEPQGKLDMDDIVAKKFDRPKREDYVDFEELPK